MKISQKVPLVVSAIIILAFSVFSWIQYHMVRDALYEKTGNSINEASVVLSHQITNWLNGKLALIDLMAQTIAADYNTDTIQNTMNTPLLKDEFILIFGGLETNGKPISNDPSWSPPNDWDARKRPWYPLARAHNRALLTDPYADSATNDILISAVANITDNGTFKGAVGGDLSLKTVSDAVNTLNFNNTGYAYLINADGEIISHPDSSLNGKQLTALFGEKRPSLTPDLQELELENRSVLTAFRPLENLYGSEWLIGVVLEKDKVMADAYNLSLNAVIGAVISALVASLVLYMIMGRLLLTPIRNLTEIADEISRGKLGIEINETKRSDEIGALSKAIERMGISLQMAFDRLKKK
ncbi:cache domain-containing protein [Motiliproteus sp. MSK22-1]|uniref:HAMP domain-containing protein n=1 Tax=Motiliproteus sp. MSK22-1 TaxID=1897630 RepID=UPI000977AE9A|nr:cache domain-containing protein [Motiliproteus sp. MSK22-1]OMH26595.1 hypothetical protein BGP75_23135 [Motiliproteus sp. MSK22-1]